MEGRAGAGALGPRLAGRLTAELILRSPQYLSCVKDYEIDLRGQTHALQQTVLASKVQPTDESCRCFAGHKLTAIENLGATEVTVMHSALILLSQDFTQPVIAVIQTSRNLSLL